MARGGTQLGISVSDRSIEIVEISQKKGLGLAAASRVEFEKGVIDRGIIVDEQRFAALLQQAIAEGKPRGFSTKRAAFSMPDVVSYLHVLRFPPTITPQELRTAVRFQVEEIIPLKPQETVSDFLVTERHKDHTDVLYVAVHRAAFEGYVRALRQAGLDLISVGVDSIALSRLLPPMKLEGDEARLLADLGARTATLLVADGVGIRSSFTRFTAGEAMTQAIADGQKLDLQKAEAQKKKNGLTGDAKMKKILSPFVDRMGIDLASTIAWHEQHHASRVQEVVFVGGTSLLPGIVEALTKAVQASRPKLIVRLADVWRLVTPQSGVSVQKSDGLFFAPAIGAALWGLRNPGAEVNLLKPRLDVAAVLPAALKTQAKTPAVRSTLRRLPLGIALPTEPKERRKLIASFLFVLVAIGALVVALSLRSKKTAEVNEQLSALENQQTSEELTATLAGKEFVIPYATDPQSSATLPMRHVVLENLSQSTVIQPDASGTVDGIATGEVRLINTSGTDQSLVATTRLLSEGGVLFRLRDAVTVSAGDEAVAVVYADQPGASGDIGPSAFSIPGLPEARQAEVYGVSDTAMTGGVVATGEIQQETVDAAVLQMAEDIRSRATEFFGTQIASGEATHSGLSEVTVTSITVTPPVGVSSAEAEVLIVYTLQSLVYAEEDAEQIVRAQLEKEGVIVADDLTIVIAITAVDASDGLSSGRLRATASVHN